MKVTVPVPGVKAPPLLVQLPVPASMLKLPLASVVPEAMVTPPLTQT